MALYNDGSYLSQSDSDAFTATHNPGSKTPDSGIYRCAGCGYEIVSEKPKTFPPESHHAHTTAQGKVRWQLIVFAQHKT